MYFKIYFVIFLILFLCTLESDGFILGLLLRIIALKGALFIGTPIALGSFLIGQGIGFMGGSLFGGYSMFQASQKYHDYEKSKWIAAPPPPPPPPPIKFSSSYKNYGYGVTRYPYDPTYYIGKPQGYTESYKDYDGGGGYGVGNGQSGHITHDTGYQPVKGNSYFSLNLGYKPGKGHSHVVSHDTGYLPVNNGHSHVSHDTGYLPVNGHSHVSHDTGYLPPKGHSYISHDTGGYSYGKGNGYGHGHGHGIDHYSNGYSKGLLLGSGIKGFKAGFHKPIYVDQGGYYGWSSGLGSGKGSYGQESQHPSNYYQHPNKNNGYRPSLFERLMTVPNMLRGNKPKPYGPGPGPGPGPRPGNHWNNGFSGPKSPNSPPYTSSEAQLESTLQGYDSPGKEYTGLISDEKYSDPGESIENDEPNSRDTSGSIPSYSESNDSVDAESTSGSKKKVIKSYEGHDKPKSEPMGLGYFNNEYDSGITSDDLIQAYSSSRQQFPKKPNEYGNGKPLGEAMGPSELKSYYNNNNNNNKPELLDIKSSIQFDVSKQFPVTKKFGKEQQHDLLVEQGSSSSIQSSNIIPAPNVIIEKYLEEKLEEKIMKAKNEIEKKETKHLIELLRKVYIKQLIDSLNTGSGAGAGKPQDVMEDIIPDFKPLPNFIPNSTTTTAEPSTSIPSSHNISTQIPEEEISTVNSLHNSSTTATVSSSIQPTQESHVDNIQSSFRPKRQSLPMTTPASSSIENPNNNNNNNEEPTMNKEQQEKLIIKFIDDVKNFFVLVSALDQDTCLQKLVCDVHTRVDQSHQLTTYELNILSTFRIMDTLMPPDMEDSSAPYRRAARIGVIGSSPEICQKSYSNCSYSTNQIINLGKEIENVDADSSNLNPTSYIDNSNIEQYYSEIIPVMPRV